MRFQRFAFVVMVLCLPAPLTRADDPPSIPSLVARAPASHSAGEAALSAELLKLGPTAIREVCAMLVPLGTGDDTQARDTLEGLRRYVTRTGTAADQIRIDVQRDLLCQALATALSDAKDVEVKTFLLEQLKWVGKDECVPAVAPLLSDPALCKPATLTLLEIRTPAAAAALVKALPSAQGGNRVTIIKALGTKRDNSASDEVLKSAGSDDATLRLAALWALANVGTPQAADLLAKAANAQGVLERAEGTSDLLLYATRRAEKGDKDDAAKICRDLIQTRTAAGDSHARSAALHTLVKVLGDAASDDVLTAADSLDATYRNAALNLAVSHAGLGTTTVWVEKLKKAEPVVKVDVLWMLARRRDSAATPAVAEALRDPEASVRMAAIPALVALDRDAAARELLGVVESDHADEAKAAAEAMARIPTPVPLALAADALPKASPAAKVLLLDLLGSRAAENQADAVFAQTADTNAAVRLAALRAIEKIAGPADEQRLIDFALQTHDAGEEAAALKAATSTTARTPDTDHRGDAFVAALARATGAKRAALMHALPRVGGKAALDALLTDARGSDSAARDAAVRALTDWPDAAALGPLLDLARTAPPGDAGTTQNVLAVRGLLQLVKSSKSLSSPERVAHYADVLAAARRPEERNQVLAALAAERTLSALKVVSAALEDPATSADAAPAAVRMILPAKAGDPGLRGEAADAALRRAIPLLKDAKLRERAEKQLAGEKHD